MFRTVKACERSVDWEIGTVQGPSHAVYLLYENAESATASDHTASGIWSAAKIRRRARPSTSAKWMSGPASATAAFTARAPTPGPPTSPHADVRQAPPTGDLRRRPPPHALALGINGPLQCV